MTIRDWQKQRLEQLRTQTFSVSRHVPSVTLLVYTFPPKDREEAFDWIEFSVLHSWSLLGRLKTVIVADRRFSRLDSFAAKWSHDVEVQIEDSLTPGEISSMSYDCVTKLHTRFSTDYVLIVQDDGFPIRDNLNDFLGKYDFIGAPCVRDSRRKLMNALGFPCLNGGFSLRSKRICEAAAKSWHRWWHFFINQHSRFFSEDTFYTLTACLSPAYRLKFKFANEKSASDFAYEHLDGLIAPAKTDVPFGFHGRSTFDCILTQKPEWLNDSGHTRSYIAAQCTTHANKTESNSNHSDYGL